MKINRTICVVAFVLSIIVIIDGVYAGNDDSNNTTGGGMLTIDKEGAESSIITTGKEAMHDVSTPANEMSAVLISEIAPTRLQAYVYSNIPIDAGGLFIGKARGTEASPTIVKEGDRLGWMLGRGYDGTSWQNPAGFTVKVDGPVSTGSVPARISFETGASYPTRQERLVIKYNGNVGIGTTSPLYKLHVNGTIRAEGSDFAEPFDMTDKDLLEIGDVVVIDTNNPLHLKKSTKAYDTMVAGIISSNEQAGYVAGGRSDGSSDKPVALSGRVLCKVTTENGPIVVGDLLTSSTTHGHAMKASDRDKSFGAVIGKALQPLATGKGEVMVLVALQ